ncbi:MAG: DnaJ C-terminal domain-containing protein [Vampirovibrionales bacterium]|nr:DnaJ C-terminal domain-containing protein [Vampirovibrionales bacterium]
MAGFQNHYKTLGLPNGADAAAVKAAYRKVAREAHPDLNPTDATATERLKTINAAYDVLGNPDKKKTYDDQLAVIQARADQINPRKSGQQSSPKNNASTEANLKDASTTSSKASTSEAEAETPRWAFDRFLNKQVAKKAPAAGATDASGTTWGVNRWFEGKPSPKKPSPQEQPKRQSQPEPRIEPRRGEDVRVDTHLTAKEAAEGTRKTVHVKHKDPCPACVSTGLLNGKQCLRCQGERQLLTTRKLEVNIPVGVVQGSKVRVAGEGGHGLFGGDNGDLYLIIRIKGHGVASETASSAAEPRPASESNDASTQKSETTAPKESSPITPEANTDETFKIDGLTVRSAVKVPLVDAVLGGEIRVATVHGAVTVTIPAGTNSGQVLRLKGMGIAEGDSDTLKKGDHLATVQIDLPSAWLAGKGPSAAETIVLERLRPQTPPSSD